MFEVTIIFLLVIGISFIGSLQPGPVNMTVFQNTLSGGYKKGIVTAIGGSIPELFYSFLALWFSSFILSVGIDKSMISYFVGIIMILIGIYYFVKKHFSKTVSTRSGPAFVTGLSMGLLNPLLFTYWLTISGWMLTIGLMAKENTLHKISFMGGAFFGALIFLFAIARIVSNTKEISFFRNTTVIDYITGTVLGIMGFWLLAKTYFS